MLTGHFPRTVLFLAATSLLTGCASTGPSLSRHTALGTLKTSLSHVEFENEQLRTKVAKLESENRAIENRLVQEEAVNGDLSARLDDARNLLAHQGYDWNGSTGPAGRDEPPSNEPPSRALPAGRSNRKPRKPPFAQIPGRIDSSPPANISEDAAPQSRVTNPGAFGPQSWRDDDVQWLPIARGTNGTASKVR